MSSLSSSSSSSPALSSLSEMDSWLSQSCSLHISVHRPRIRADNEFRKDIKQLRSKTGRNYVEVLIRFHNRRIDSLRSALHKQKRTKNSGPKTDSTVTRKPAFARSALSETVTAETVQKAEKTIEELQRIVKLFNSNKEKRDYTCLLNDSHNTKRRRWHTKPSRVRNKMRNLRRKNNRIDQFDAQTEADKKHIKNFSNVELTNDQINLQAKGLKFIPTPKQKEIQIRRHLLKDFDQLARKIRPSNIFIMEKITNRTLSTSNLTGFLRFNIQWPLKAISKKLEFYSQKSNFQSLKTISLTMNKENSKRLGKTPK